ncbi:MAG TPA: hypothetical protein PLU88_06425 [Armatimonadota bacterium]|nr:hypothetical protein [Armatimonadota bacterium]HOM72302.1 hypothetical protein [Armatimonadota bacterium]HPP74742.1 hypothetical protein [Armatimonadota bacterium]
METIEILLALLIGLLFLMWITVVVVTLVIFWRIRKVVLGLMIALRGISELTKQISDLSKSIGEAKKRFERKAG